MGIICFISYIISFLSFYIYRYKLEQKEYGEPWQKHKMPMYLYILVFVGCLIPGINFMVSLSIWVYILTESSIRIKRTKFINFLTKEL